MNSKASRLHPVAAGLCVLVLMFGFCSTTATPYDPEAIRTELERIVREHQIPSIGYALVTRDAVIVADAVGMADEEQRIPAGPENLYRVGSITKSFVALGILRRVSEGELDLDARVVDLVPELPMLNPWEETHPLLLRHLLEHTSGFPDFWLRDFLLPEGSPLPDLESVVNRRTGQWQSRWQPGTRWAYSNISYTLLAHILEKNTGIPYHEYLGNLILEPAGMEQADFLGRDLSKLARSCNAAGNPLSPVPIHDHPAGYLHATPVDMGRWVHFLLNEPDWLPAGGLETISRPSSIIGAGNGMIGYGLGIYSEPAGGYIAIGHNGGIEGYLSKYAVFPEEGVGFWFTLTKVDGPAYEAVNRYLRGLLLEERAVEGLPFEGIVDPQMSGWYRPASHRIEAIKLASDLTGAVFLKVVDGDISMQGLTGNKTRLLSTGDGYFRTEGSAAPTHFIGKSEERWVISHGFSFWERATAVEVLLLPVMFALGLLLFLLFPLVALLIHGIQCLRKSVRFTWAAVVPLVGTLSLVSMVSIMAFMAAQSNGSVVILTTVNPYSVGVLVLSLLQPMLWATSVVGLWRSWSSLGALTRLLLALACAGWLMVWVVLAAYGSVPEITWNW